MNKRNKWNTLSWVAFLIASEKFGLDLISHLKFIYIKWSIIQHGETCISGKDVVRPLSRTKTIPGTRLFNQFIPLSRGKIATKRVSEDIDYSVKFELEQVQELLSLLMVSIGQFVMFL